MTQSSESKYPQWFQTARELVAFTAGVVVILSAIVSVMFFTVRFVISIDVTPQLNQQAAELTAVRLRLDGVDARFDAVGTRFDGVDARLGEIDTRLGEIDARFDAVDTRLSEQSELLRAILDQR